MSLGFSSIRRQMIFYAMAFFMASLCTSVGISYYYLNRENVTDQYLMQQTSLNFCLQELENNIFYSKISELSNLSIIRNELYRLYRIVDMSLVNADEPTAIHTPYRAAPSAPESVAPPLTIEELSSTRAQDQLPLDRAPKPEPAPAVKPTTPFTNASSLQQAHDQALSGTQIPSDSPLAGLSQLSAQLKQGTTTQPRQPHFTNGTDNASFHSAADIIARANTHYDQMLERLSEVDLSRSNLITTLDQNRALIPMPGMGVLSRVDPNRLVLYKHLSQLQSLGFIAFSVNTKSSAQDLYIHRGYEELLDKLVNDQRRLRDLLYNNPIPDNGYFVILENVDGSIVTTNPALSPEARALQDRNRPAPAAPRPALAAPRPAQTTSPAPQPVAPAPEANSAAVPVADGIMVHAADLDQAIAAAAGMDLPSRTYEQMVLAPHDVPAEAIEEEEEVKAQPVPPAQQVVAPSIKPSGSDFSRRYDEALGNRRLGRENNDIATLTDHGTYLGLIASLSFAPDQILVIISDITKLQQQDEVLKRLIANSLNELVLSVGATTPVSITLFDEYFNPLAGDLSQNELTRLITPAVLDETRKHGMFQGYNHRWGHYLTTGYFKPYNWYLLINTDNVRASSAIWQYLIIIFTVQLIMSIICVFAISEVVDRDVKDLNIINHKIKNMATLIQDADLVKRISDGMPQRQDELGTLANYVRLLGKTLYQSMQELIKNNARPVTPTQESERLLFERMRQNNINREIFLKEYYKNRFNVHTEHAEDTTGDFYDVIELAPGKVALVVGSSNERGLTAVNISMLNIALLRQLIRLTESIKLPLSKAVMELNQNIVENNVQAILTSVCVVIIEQQTGKVEYLNAGHTLPMLYHKDSGFEYIDIRTGPVLGVKGNQQYTSVNFELQDGDSLLLYSDGLLDCTNHRKEKLGQEGFESMLHDENFDRAVDVVNNLCTKLKRYTKDSTLQKDYTIACYHFTKNA